jgi:hypothetical protein
MATTKKDSVPELINRILIHVFGEEATHVIYKYLEHNYSLKRDQVVERIDVFAKGLEDFLSSGAYVVERRILEDINSSYGLRQSLEFEERGIDFNFVDQIRSLMKHA